MKLQTIKAKAQKGFTLIELMIAVAIVGILSAVALPAYQDYTIRAQVTEGVSLAGGAKAFVAEYHSNKGDFPDADAAAEYPGATGKYVSEVTIGEDGVITATFGGDANSNISDEAITLTPTVESNGNLSWECAAAAETMEAKYLPSSCK